MKWPNDPKLPADTVTRLNKRIQEFLDADGSTNGGANAPAVRQLLLDLFSIHQSCVGAGNEVARQIELARRGLEWDTEEPSLAHIQKYINRLFSGQPDKATAYIDRAINDRTAADTALARDTLVQTGGRGGLAKKAKTAAIIDAAMRDYCANPQRFKTKKEAARHLEANFPPVAHSTYYRKLRNLNG